MRVPEGGCEVQDAKKSYRVVHSGKQNLFTRFYYKFIPISEIDPASRTIGSSVKSAEVKLHTYLQFFVAPVGTSTSMEQVWDLPSEWNEVELIHCNVRSLWKAVGT